MKWGWEYDSAHDTRKHWAGLGASCKSCDWCHWACFCAVHSQQLIVHWSRLPAIHSSPTSG